MLGGPLGDLDRYENPQTMVINWAQDAFGGKEQIALLMQQVGRPCALADADQQDAADTLAEAGEAPVGVSLPGRVPAGELYRMDRRMTANTHDTKLPWEE